MTRILCFQILAGHKENAEFALAMCPTEPFVLSGGLEYIPTCMPFVFLSRNKISQNHV